MSTEIIFTRDFLIALSNWQGGWAEQDKRRIFADELVKQCEKLPNKFKEAKGTYFRKRFIIQGEIIPILRNNEFFEGIASWTKKKDIAKEFKGYIRENTKFAMVFKHKPLANEVVININSLWENSEFKEAVKKFVEEDVEGAKYLLGFKDSQQEIVLKSTLKGTEIEDIVGVSSSFETICDMARIPEKNREKLSIQYARNPNGIPIEIPIFVGKSSTKKSVNNVLKKLKKMIKAEEQDRLLIDWSKAAKPHPEDLKHKPE